MSSMDEGSSPAADEFQALEQKVLRAVEVLRREREARAAAEGEAARLREQVERARREAEEMSAEMAALQRERTEVRQRVAAMLHTMDELL